MISSGHLIGFTLASLVIIVTPGPGALFVARRALAHGRRTAVATAAGHAAGNYLGSVPGSPGGSAGMRSSAAPAAARTYPRHVGEHSRPYTTNPCYTTWQQVRI